MSLLEGLWLRPYLLKAAGAAGRHHAVSCQAVPTSPPFPVTVRCLWSKQLTPSHSWDQDHHPFTSPRISWVPRGAGGAKDAAVSHLMETWRDRAFVLGLTFEAGSARVREVVADGAQPGLRDNLHVPLDPPP